MAQKHTLEELNNCSREELITIVLMMQGQLDALNDNIEKLIEQVRIANNYRFGRHTESLKSIEGQLSFFDEADAAYDESSREPSAEEVITAKRAKKKGQRNIDLKDFPEEITEPSNKLLITGEPETIQRIKKEAEEYFRSYLYIYCSDPFFLEIMPPRIDKAHSLLKLLTSIGLSAEQMICCGDGYHDLTMIETAGLGVAMANAQPMVLERADYITKSNDEDGVLHVINKFMLEKN